MTASFWKAFFVSLSMLFVLLGGVAWGVSLMLVTPPPKRLMTPAFQMDLANGWTCHQEGPAWLCEPSSLPGDTVAVFAMKYRGKDDTLKAYADYLHIPKALTMRDLSKQASQVKYVKLSRIGSYEWVDSLHLGSEIGTYYTHYLATVTSNISILVSFSAHKDSYEKYYPQLERMIASLLVYEHPLNGGMPAANVDATIPAAAE